jgi:aspartate/methionine/tyrosine aminotransferase
MSITDIPELNALSFRENLSDKYQRKYGSPPFDLSHWDPSKEILQNLIQYLDLPEPPCVMPYIFSYELDDINEKLIERFALTNRDQDLLIVPTGTSAITFAAWWLKCLDIEQVIILCPAYFSSFYSCDVMKLSYRKIYLRRESKQWQLPYEEIEAAVKKNAKTVLWITNPIYTTGVYFGQDEVNFLNSLLKAGITVLIDECHSINGKEITPRLIPSERLLSLVSPHKSVCINAAKFAAIIFDLKYRRFFADWTDVLIGGLSTANYTAILHFLSPNFLEFQNVFNTYIQQAHDEVKGVISELNGAIEVDDAALGYLMSCYAPNIPAIGNCEEVLEDIIFNSGATMIPGTRNHFAPEIGFNFRINLARACPQFSSSFHRVAAYIASYNLRQYE